MGNVLSMPTINLKNITELYKTRIWLSTEGINSERLIYGWLDLLGDLGGVTQVISLVFGVFLLPISEHSFILKATSKLFLANTKVENMF